MNEFKIEIEKIIRVASKEKDFIDGIAKLIKNELKDFVDIVKIIQHIEQINDKIDILKDLQKILGSKNEYNEHFYNYVKHESKEFETLYLNYKNENMRQIKARINSGNIDISQINKSKIENYMYDGYGAGGRGELPFNQDERLVFEIKFLEDNQTYFLEKIDDFVNNLKILKDFSKIDMNVVIIGSNGSGKSTLSRRIKVDSIDNINIVSSHHILHMTSEDFIIPRYKNEHFDLHTYQSDKKLVSEHEEFDKDLFINSLHNLTNHLLHTHHTKKGDTNGNREEQTKLELILNTCNQILKKEMVILNGVIACLDEKGNSYDFDHMSDGERQVYYFVASVLINDKEGYIIVDEPENHLNPQVCNLLWNRLENLKKESTFVYITHDPKFAMSRANSKIIWSKKFTYPDKWDYEIIENDEIPEDLLLEVLGSKENIIFCEGTTESLDKRLYDTIFFENKIIPVEGHYNVYNYTKAINKIRNLNISAIGIIDNDGMLEKEIDKYNKNNVWVLPFNEIEMLLFTPEVMEKVAIHYKKMGEIIDVDLWKNKVFEICNREKERILTQIVKSRVDNILANQKIHSPKCISDIKSNLQELINEIDVDTLYIKELTDLDEILKDENYEKLLKICNLKNEIVRRIPQQMNRIDNYADKAVSIIQNDAELREVLKDKYFNS